MACGPLTLSEAQGVSLDPFVREYGRGELVESFQGMSWRPLGANGEPNGGFRCQKGCPTPYVPTRVKPHRNTAEF